MSELVEMPYSFVHDNKTYFPNATVWNINKKVDHLFHNKILDKENSLIKMIKIKIIEILNEEKDENGEPIIHILEEEPTIVSNKVYNNLMFKKEKKATEIKYAFLINKSKKLRGHILENMDDVLERNFNYFAIFGDVYNCIPEVKYFLIIFLFFRCFPAGTKLELLNYSNKVIST
ncbi:AA_TRNA_LIGASE_II domain-containing protein [Meloidogyne graminicola]|uniref:AA_TRNA_LIGASE_II domain-containing protein n=1 Tax=Meloidogyne graminicola TaxID=189291 RepID=A0A8S9ZLF2_9BILA|nr:AA_TRNA_LIGASE_II domain-containing protein [Meloidogyne graminicola]